MKRVKLGATARIILVLVVLGVAVFPLYWMFVTSLTSDANYFGESTQFFPDFSRFGIYVDALTGTEFPTWLLNSLIIALGTCLVSITLGIPFAYALSRFSFRGKVLVTIALLLTQMLPEALLVVPLFAIFREFNLLDTQAALILANAAFVLPIVAFILKGAIDGIPQSLDEAARVDGCRSFTVLTRISIPLITPSIAATAVIAFFHGWNEYVFAVTFIFNPANMPASVGLASFIGELSTPLQTMMAVAFMYTLPAVTFYLIVQKYVVSGITAGSVKG